jgi:hypothetical protein
LKSLGSEVAAQSAAISPSLSTRSRLGVS